MNNNKLDDDFEAFAKDELEKFEMPVSDELWNRIDHHYQNSKESSNLASFLKKYKFFIGGTVILIGLCWFLLNETSQESAKNGLELNGHKVLVPTSAIKENSITTPSPNKKAIKVVSNFPHSTSSNGQSLKENATPNPIIEDKVTSQPEEIVTSPEITKKDTSVTKLVDKLELPVVRKSLFEKLNSTNDSVNELFIKKVKK